MVGTQTFGSTLTYGASSIFEWDLNASTSDTRVGETYDKVVASAANAVTGSSAIFTVLLGTNAFTDAFWNTNKTWTDIFTSGTGSALSRRSSPSSPGPASPLMAR